LTIQIELSPDEEAWVREQATRVGQTPEQLARELLRTRIPASGRPGRALLPVTEAGVFHPDRWERVLQALTERGAVLPSISSETHSREALYQDHD